MRAGDGKTLFLRNLPANLVREVKSAAAHRGQTLTTLVAEALARSLRVDSDMEDRADDLHHDMEWYQKNRANLLRRYQGEYVAIVEATVVDHGPDFSALATRVFARFGNRNIYMPRVETGEPTARIRSPRRAKP